MSSQSPQPQTAILEAIKANAEASSNSAQQSAYTSALNFAQAAHELAQAWALLPPEFASLPD